MKSVLFYRRGGLGDTLLTFPALEILKKRGYEITVIGKKEFYKIAKEVGWVDHIYEDLYPQVLNKHYEKKIFFSKLEGIDPFPKERVWIVKYYLEVLNLSYEFSPILPVSPLEQSPLAGKIVIHPGSGSLKKIPNFLLFQNIENFLTKSGLEVIYFVGEADKWLKNLVSSYWESEDPLEIARALKLAKGFIGVDSGISHLASYLGVKSYLFFGPTDEIVWKPIGINVKIIKLDLDCSPCFPKVCEERPCLNPDLLFEKFKNLFNLN